MNAYEPGVSEYDRFGPWIDEVTTLEDVPRLFRDHPIDFGAARLVLKVPRNIPHRDATPQMDLYDHLLVLEPEQLTILSRHRGKSPRDFEKSGYLGYDVLTFPLADIVAIRDVVNLLDGRLSIATSSGASITVRYHGSARATVSALVDKLRADISARPPSAASAALRTAARPVANLQRSAHVEPADLVLINDFHEVQRSNPDLTAWAVHGRTRLDPAGTGLQVATQRVLHALSRMTLHGAVVAADANVMEIIGRHAWLVRGNSPVHSASRLVVPLSAIDRVDIRPHQTYPDAAMVTIHSGASKTVLVVPIDSDARRLFDAATS